MRSHGDEGTREDVPGATISRRRDLHTPRWAERGTAHRPAVGSDKGGTAISAISGRWFDSGVRVDPAGPPAASAPAGATAWRVRSGRSRGRHAPSHRRPLNARSSGRPFLEEVREKRLRRAQRSTLTAGGDPQGVPRERLRAAVKSVLVRDGGRRPGAVSYTHLTLPTKRIV